MKIRIIKAMNLFLVLVVLFAYQSYAKTRDEKVQAYEAKQEEADAAWDEYNSAVAAIEALNNAASSQTAEASEAETGVVDGTYTGIGLGFAGDITVEMVISGGKITSCEVTAAPDEDPEYMDMVKDLPAAIVTAQSADVDTVTGATLSSEGIIEAAKACLTQAGWEE